ncbi:hypothetical protein E8E12_001211 [Didymella heteroderae]|uniref:Uncharacterized protein n=1 Tax=Didymella heteroderae TaxID=1769908 RepID=A0A9P4WHH0_9PLEO|nr:hypothetical protein E8E12_001211 [Didymella heteroderae]
MVYNSDIDQEKELIHAIVTADLTHAQLTAVHERFGLGAMMESPYPRWQLYITDKRSWSSLSHLETWHKTPRSDDAPGYFPVIIIDAETPKDNAVWFIDRIANQFDVDHGTAENLNTLFKVRMDLKDIPLEYVNYDIANTDIRHAMDKVGIPYLTPEHFTQEKPYSLGFDTIRDRYLSRAVVTAEPEEMEESRDLKDLSSFLPQPEVVYRLKDDVARAHGLQTHWTIGFDELDDRFPKGSKILQLYYDPEHVVPRYEKPEGSL